MLLDYFTVQIDENIYPNVIHRCKNMMDYRFINYLILYDFSNIPMLLSNWNSKGFFFYKKRYRTNFFDKGAYKLIMNKELFHNFINDIFLNSIFSYDFIFLKLSFIKMGIK